jgi:hypothetical protein
MTLAHAPKDSHDLATEGCAIARMFRAYQIVLKNKTLDELNYPVVESCKTIIVEIRWIGKIKLEVFGDEAFCWF